MGRRCSCRDDDQRDTLNRRLNNGEREILGRENLVIVRQRIYKRREILPLDGRKCIGFQTKINRRVLAQPLRRRAAARRKVSERLQVNFPPRPVKSFMLEWVTTARKQKALEVKALAVHSSGQDTIIQSPIPNSSPRLWRIAPVILKFRDLSLALLVRSESQAGDL